jgi:hypothetical protein
MGHVKVEVQHPHRGLPSYLLDDGEPATAGERRVPCAQPLCYWASGGLAAALALR